MAMLRHISTKTVQLENVRSVHGCDLPRDWIGLCPAANADIDCTTEFRIL